MRVSARAGAALFADTYGGPGARMIGDVDIPVSGLRLRAGLAAVDDLGYRLTHRYPGSHHAYGEFVRDSRRCSH